MTFPNVPTITELLHCFIIFTSVLLILYSSRDVFIIKIDLWTRVNKNIKNTFWLISLITTLLAKFNHVNFTFKTFLCEILIPRHKIWWKVLLVHKLVFHAGNLVLWFIDYFYDELSLFILHLRRLLMTLIDLIKKSNNDLMEFAVSDTPFFVAEDHMLY